MKSIVIKCGGSVFESLPESFYQEIVQLQESGRCFPILVHGGGPIISKLLSKLNIPTTFQKGLRVTTKEVLDVVEMVLNGLINKNIVSRLIQTGGTSVGLSGVDGSLIKAEQLDKNKELGWVGKVTEVNGKFLKAFKEQGLIPVVSPIGIGSAGEHYNINADAVAAAIAQAFRAPLCFVTDVPGISFNQNGLKH